MTQAVLKDVPDVVVGEAVVDDTAHLAPLDDATVPQESQLMAERGIADLDQQGKVADAELRGQGERVQQSRARRVRQQLEDRGDIVRFAAWYDATDDRRHRFGMQSLMRATRGRHSHICTIVQILAARTLAWNSLKPAKSRWSSWSNGSCHSFY